MTAFVLVALAASLAFWTYLRLEPQGPRRWPPMLMRAAAWGGLGALLANPGCPGDRDARAPVVLLDASLSLRGTPALARRAADTARALGEVRWFGDDRPWTDSLAERGRSALAPGLAAAVALGRRTIVVTDGELDDLPDLPADQLAAAGVVTLPRQRVRDLVVAEVQAPSRATVGDTLALSVVLRSSGSERPDSVVLVVRAGARLLGRTRAVLPPGAGTTVPLPAVTRGLAAGTQFLTVGIEAAGDGEPRNDQRLVAVEFVTTPGVVLLAEAGDWDARFLFRTLREVADLPVRGFVRLEATRWHDMDGLRPVSDAAVASAVRGADLLVSRTAAGGEPTTGARGILRWPAAVEAGGEWYLSATPPSPVAMAFLGVPAESLPPLSGFRPLEPREGDWTGITVQAGRRGAARPVLIGRESGRRREVVVGADGFWRWAFRGGPSGDVYRAMVAGSVAWLLATPESRGGEIRLVRRVVEQGLPLTFERSADSLGLVPISFESEGVTRRDTLRFAGSGRAEVWLPVGVYRYRVQGAAAESGVAAVDAWSREWLPRPVVVESRPAPPAAFGERRSARQLPWLYILVLASLAGEWVARRRLGLR